MKHFKVLSLVLAASLFITPMSSFAGVLAVPSGTTQEQLEEYIEQFIIENYKDDVTETQLNQAKIQGMFDSLDPHSNYYNSAEYKALRESLSGAFVGIGVHIEPSDNFIKVLKTIAGAPAEKVGIKAGDVITKVNGTSIYGFSSDKVVSMIRGDEGTEVKITVIKADTKKEVVYTIKRARIEVEIINSKQLDNAIGYVALSEFDSGSAMKVIAAVESFKNPKGIVLDLRGNPGGYLNEAINLADYFLPKGAQIMSIDYKNDPDDNIIDSRDGNTVPLVVLVDKGSASASEIVAIALQKNNRAKIVGEVSYGKGTVQDLFELTDGSGFKLTVAEYKGPNNTKINGVGVKPDYVVKLNDPAQAEALKQLAPMLETKTYKKGEKGLNVYAAQQRLIQLGYKVTATAVMDDQTITALKSVQTAGKLAPSGFLDSGTKKLLEEKIQALYNRITFDNQLGKALELLKVK